MSNVKNKNMPEGETTPPPEAAIQAQTIAPEGTALKPRTELTGPKERSQTFTRLRETLKARLLKINEDKTDQARSQRASEILNILEKITTGDSFEIEDVIVSPILNRDSSPQDGNSSPESSPPSVNLRIRVKIEDGKISVENTDPNQGNYDLSAYGEPQLIQALHLESIFPDLTPKPQETLEQKQTREQLQQAIAQAILNQEGDPTQLEQLGEFLGYVSCRQMRTILEIPEDSAKQEKLYLELKEKKELTPLQKAQKKYFEVTQAQEGQEKPTVYAVFTEAKDVIEILEQLNPSAKGKTFKEIIKPIVEQQNQAKRESLKVEEFAKQYGLTELLDQSLNDIVTTHYTDIQNGNEPEKFTEGTFAKLKELLMQNKAILDAKREELIKKFENGGKFVGILAIVMALLLWKSSQEGSQGGGGIH